MRSKLNLTTGFAGLESINFHPDAGDDPSTADLTLPDYDCAWAHGDITTKANVISGSLAPPGSFTVDAQTFSPQIITDTGVDWRIGGKYMVSKTEAARIRDDWSLVTVGGDAAQDWYRLGDRDHEGWASATLDGQTHSLGLSADDDILLYIAIPVDRAWVQIVNRPLSTTNVATVEQGLLFHDPGAWNGFKISMRFRKA